MASRKHLGSQKAGLVLRTAITDQNFTVKVLLAQKVVKQ
jgi:hypothetical protein